jgi:ribulose 1,5-bisphosphate carboxylase large subunit-like protein
MELNRNGTIVATYELTPQVETIDRCVDLLLHEMTSGIQYYSTRNGAVMDRVCDHVPFVDESVRGEVVSVLGKEGGSYEVTFSLPAANVDARLGGLTNLWPIVAGEVFNFYFIREAHLLDLQLPHSFSRHYRGPAFGIRGIRARVNVDDAPLFGAIIKPNVGLDVERAAQAAAHLAEAGFDFVKDDEICVNPDLCPLAERVGRISRALDEAQQKTGRKMLYMANVTSDFAALEEAASTAVTAGAGGLMIDPFCTGLSAIDFLRRKFDVPIYVHRVGYGLHSLGRDYSVSYEVFTKLFRLLGADFSHVGGIWGGSANARQKVARYLSLLRNVEPGDDAYRETWPVVSGISMESMGEYHGFYGNDTLFLEHIDIYRSVSAARDKLAALKSCVIHSGAGGAR